MKSKVSVIILNWNGKHHLERCLSSVLQQTYPNFEVVLVDNASTDGSVEFIRGKFLDVTIIRNDKNLIVSRLLDTINPLMPQMRITSEAIQLSKELNLCNKAVFFNDWVPYEERQNYLLEADVGISLHLDHVETRLAFRTRILDYIWAGLPIVTSKGDSMSELVERYNLGRVVDYEDVGQVTDTLMELLGTPNLRGVYRPGFKEVKGQFTWERAVEPLARFCAHPRLAPDKAALSSRSRFASLGQSVARPTPWWALPGKAWYIFRRSGWSALQREVKSYLRWRFSL